MSKVDFARELACFVHGDQLYGVHPYVYHLDQVAELCTEWGPEARIIAFLHDALEDTHLKEDTVRNLFGDQIADCVKAITDDPGANRAERKAATYARLGRIAENSEMAMALVVKAADRLANVRMCVNNGNKSLLEMYRREQEAFVKAVHRSGLNAQLVAETSLLFSTND